MRQITIPAGQRTVVYRRRFSSIPQEVSFSASGSSVTGTVERVGSRWILGRTNESFPLGTHNTVRKGYWDTFFEVFVTPDREVTVTVPRARMMRRLLITALALSVILIAVVFTLTRG